MTDRTAFVLRALARTRTRLDYDSATSLGDRRLRELADEIKSLSWKIFKSKKDRGDIESLRDEMSKITQALDEKRLRFGGGNFH